MSANARRTTRGWTILWLLMASTAVSCGDDATMATTNPFGTGDVDTSPITYSMPDTGEGSTTAVADDTGMGTTATEPDGTSSTGDDTTGGEVLPGQPASQLVSSGERASSRSYSVVYTMGQPSSLQSTHQSSNYTLHGGLIGANGSPP